MTARFRYPVEVIAVAVLTAATGWYRRDGYFVNDDWAFFFRDPWAVDGWLAPHAGHLVAGTIAAYKAVRVVFGLDHTAFYVLLQVVPFFVSRLAIVLGLRVVGLSRPVAIGTTVVASLVGPAGLHRLVFLTNDVSIALVMVLGWLLLDQRREIDSRLIGWLTVFATLAVTVNEQVIAPLLAFTLVAAWRRTPQPLGLIGLPGMALGIVWLLQYGEGVGSRTGRDLGSSREWFDVLRDSVAIAVEYVSELTRLPAAVAAVWLVVLVVAWVALSIRETPSPLEMILLLTIAFGIGQRALVIADLESGAEALAPRHLKQPLTELVIVFGLVWHRTTRVIEPAIAVKLVAAVAGAVILAVNLPIYADHVESIANGSEIQRNTIEIAYALQDEPYAAFDEEVSRQVTVGRLVDLDDLGFESDGPSLTGNELEQRTAQVRGTFRYAIDPVDAPGDSDGMFASSNLDTSPGCRDIDQNAARLSTTSGGTLHVLVPGPLARLVVRGDDEFGPSNRRFVVGTDRGRQWYALTIAEVPSGLSVRLRATNAAGPLRICF